MRRTAALLLVAALLAPAARAEYALPEAAERFFILVDEWTIEKTPAAGAPEGSSDVARAGSEVRTTRAGRAHAWTIDTFWLADRIDSNSICTGDYRKAMKTYLAGLPQGRILVELVTLKKGEKPFVAGIWPFDAAKMHATACEVGAPALGLDDKGVRALGGAEAFAKRLEEKSAGDWKAVEAR